MKSPFLSCQNVQESQIQVCALFRGEKNRELQKNTSAQCRLPTQLRISLPFSITSTTRVSISQKLMLMEI